jgi:hypothetical protein
MHPNEVWIGSWAVSQPLGKPGKCGQPTESRRPGLDRGALGATRLRGHGLWSNNGLTISPTPTPRNYCSGFSRPIPRFRIPNCERFNAGSGRGVRQSLGVWLLGRSARHRRPRRKRSPRDGGFAPKPPGFIAFAQALIADRAARWPPAIMPASESALGFHPWRALSSAQVAPA